MHTASSNGKPTKATVRAVWDPATQEEHGGQTWSQLGSRFVCDFSVTTNCHGSPKNAVSAARDALETIEHYPAADCRDALMALAKFTQFDVERMLVSNGASEMIELLMRVAPKGPFRASPYVAGYMEYVRAARAAGRETTQSHRDAAVSVVIHPNSPTGHCMTLDELHTYTAEAGGLVVVDESFIAFEGPNWRAQSALNLLDEFPNKLIVLFSWTKLWSCPGLRIGSVAGSTSWIAKIKSLQAPWSCNTLAQAFLVSACEDEAYMIKTWETLPLWKKEQEERVEKLGWKINKESPSWVPWVFFECPTEQIAETARDTAFEAGCPVRLCKSFGIGKCIRLGVRQPEHQVVLQKAWEKAFL